MCPAICCMRRNCRSFSVSANLTTKLEDAPYFGRKKRKWDGENGAIALELFFSISFFGGEEQNETRKAITVIIEFSHAYFLDFSCCRRLIFRYKLDSTNITLLSFLSFLSIQWPHICDSQTQ